MDSWISYSNTHPIKPEAMHIQLTAELSKPARARVIGLTFLFAASSPGLLAQAVNDEPVQRAHIKSSGAANPNRPRADSAELMKSIASTCVSAAAPACEYAAASIPPSPPAEMDERTAKGLLGDYIGGIWGTVNRPGFQGGSLV